MTHPQGRRHPLSEQFHDYALFSTMAWGPTKEYCSCSEEQGTHVLQVDVRCLMSTASATCEGNQWAIRGGLQEAASRLMNQNSAAAASNLTQC